MKLVQKQTEFHEIDTWWWCLRGRFFRFGWLRGLLVVSTFEEEGLNNIRFPLRVKFSPKGVVS
jgi:hypothetical protein